MPRSEWRLEASAALSAGPLDNHVASLGGSTRWRPGCLVDRSEALQSSCDELAVTRLRSTDPTAAGLDPARVESRADLHIDLTRAPQLRNRFLPGGKGHSFRWSVCDSCLHRTGILSPGGTGPTFATDATAAAARCAGPRLYCRRHTGPRPPRCAGGSSARQSPSCSSAMQRAGKATEPTTSAGRLIQTTRPQPPFPEHRRLGPAASVVATVKGSGLHSQYRFPGHQRQRGRLCPEARSTPVRLARFYRAEIDSPSSQ